MDSAAIPADRPTPTPGTRARVHPATLLLALAMFTTGFSGLVNEYVLATTASYILGDSIVQWSLTIATMMAMMGLGCWVQKLFKERGLVDKFAIIEVCLALVGGYAPLANYTVFGYEPALYQFVSLGLAACIGLFVGLEIPLVMRINAQFTDSLKVNAAWVFGLDYVGSFVGAIVWLKWLLPNFPLTELSFIVSGTNFLVALLTAVFFWRKGLVRRMLLISALMALTLGMLFYGYKNNRSWNLALEQKFYEDRIVYVENSRYQHIVITEDQTIGNYELYINGNKQFSSIDEHIYHEMLVHPALSFSQSRNVLILGGGDGLALREVLKYPEVQSVTLVDIDPAMIRLAKTHPVLRKLNRGAFDDARIRTLVDGAFGSNPKVTTPIFMETGKIDVTTGHPKTAKAAIVEVLNVDAGKYLDSVSGRFDVIIMDLPDPNSPELVKLYSREAFGRVRARLSQNGIVVIQATSPYHAKDAYLTIGMTMRAAGFATIPYHVNVPSFGEWGYYLGVCGSHTHEALLLNKIITLQQFGAATIYATPEFFRASLVFPKGWLESSKAGVNTISNPVLLELYLHEAWRIE
jgi:spermidine synthase